MEAAAALSPWVPGLLPLRTPWTFLGGPPVSTHFGWIGSHPQSSARYAPDQSEPAVPSFPVIGPGLANEASALSLGVLTGRRGGWRHPGENQPGPWEEVGEALGQLPARTAFLLVPAAVPGRTR